MVMGAQDLEKGGGFPNLLEREPCLVKKGPSPMRAFVSLAAVAALLAACAPSPSVEVSVYPKPGQPRHPMTVAAPVETNTVRYIRPDATGQFPGDYAAAWNARPAYEAAHHGGGQPVHTTTVTGPAHVRVSVPEGKYAPAGKYTAPGKYTASQATTAQTSAVYAGTSFSGSVAGRRPVPGHSAYEAHRVYRPPMDCYIISQSTPEPWVGKRYACIED